MGYGLQDIKLDIDKYVRDIFEDIRRQAKKYLDDKILLENKNEISDKIELAVCQSATEIWSYTQNKTENLRCEIDQLTGLELTKLSFPEAPMGNEAPKVELISNSGSPNTNEEGWWSKSVNVVRKMIFNVTPGGFLGGAIGGIIGVGIDIFSLGFTVGGGTLLGVTLGTSLGGIAGAQKGMREELEQISEKDFRQRKAAMSEPIMSFIKKGEQEIKEGLQTVFIDMQRSMPLEFEQLISREKATNKESLNSIKQVINKNEQEIQQRRIQIKHSLQLIDKSQKDAEKLIQDLVEKSADEKCTAYDTGDWAE